MTLTSTARRGARLEAAPRAVGYDQATVAEVLAAALPASLRVRKSWANFSLS